MSKLDNYLRSSRRGAGLSQDEMAYLLGVRAGAIASRYERFKRRPALETALVYEAIFRTPVRELFAGIYEKAERSAARRARLLRKRLLAGGRCTMPKLKLLDALAPEKPARKP
jgi:DNA-binding XRE family transcriptional regulator